MLKILLSVCRQIRTVRTVVIFLSKFLRGKSAVKEEQDVNANVKVEPTIECHSDETDNEKPVEDEESDVSKEIKKQRCESTMDINMNAEPDPKVDSVIKSDVDAPKADGGLIVADNFNNNAKEVKEEGALKVLVDEEVPAADEIEVSCKAGQDTGAAEYSACDEREKSCSVDARRNEDEDVQVSQLLRK